MTERKEKTWSKDSAFDREADMEEFLGKLVTLPKQHWEERHQRVFRKKT